MYISSIQLQNFRNFNHLYVEFPHKGAVFIGENGVGKTNLLESIYFLTSGRSQRGVSKSAMISHHHHTSYIEAHFKKKDNSSSFSDIYSVGFSKNKEIVLKKNGMKTRLFSEFFNTFYIFSFGIYDTLLLQGEPLSRRKFIDRILCYIDPLYLEALVTYKKNILQRNKLLQIKDFDSLDVYEQILSESGSIIIEKRIKFFLTIDQFFKKYLHLIQLSDHAISFLYISPYTHESITRNDIYLDIQKKFFSARKKDSMYGFSTFGPHKDDFSCSFDNINCKYSASLGQLKSLVFALKMSIFDLLKLNGKENILFLIDDALGELDEKNIGSILSIIYNANHQIFVTSLKKNSFFYDSLKVYIIKNSQVITQ